MSLLLPPAPEGSFRLFRLLSLYPTPTIEIRSFPYPSSNHKSSLLNDEFFLYGENALLSQCPPYDAISYAWNPHIDADLDTDVENSHNCQTHSCAASDSTYASGAGAIPLATHTILVASNGHAGSAISVTEHLLHALLTAQELCAPAWLFVDAICIDQADPRDKTTQVQGMDRVYRGAQRVLVWLGVDTFPSTIVPEEARRQIFARQSLPMGACLSQIPLLVEALEAYLNGREHGKHIESNSASGGLLGALGLPAKDDPLWPALERLRLNPWFTRLWIVQEVALSQNAVLLYGQHSLPWSIYVHLTTLCESIIANLFSQQHASELVNQLYYAYNSRVSAMAKLQPLVAHLYKSTENEVRMDSNDSTQRVKVLLNLIRKSRVSVPLDRVYAIVGLLSDSMRDFVRIDYSTDMMENYWLKWTELCQAMLQFAPDIAEEMFSSAGYLDRHPHLPSWCPNLADDSDKKGITGVATNHAGMPGGNNWDRPDEDFRGMIVPGTSNIRLQGIKVDEVAYVVDLSWVQDKLQWSRIYVDQDGDIDSEVAQNIIVAFWKCIEHMTELGTSASDSDAILARCLIANAYDEQAVQPTQISKDYMAFMRYLEHYCYGPLSSAPMKKATKTAALKFGNRFQRMARKRAIFVTTTGRCGLCSSKTQKGDLLYVILNYRLPYLFRRSADGEPLALVGETYVDGIMRGEVFNYNKLDQGVAEIVVC